MTEHSLFSVRTVYSPIFCSNSSETEKHPSESMQPTPLLSQRIVTAMNSPHYQRNVTFRTNEYLKAVSSHDVCDFVYGNPREMPLPELLSAYHKYVEPMNTNWYAYCNAANPNTRPSREIIAQNLSQRFSPLSFDAEDIYLVTGNVGGIYTCLSMLLNKHDQVIFPIPGWPFYEPMILGCQGTSIEVKIDLNTFDLDLQAIQDQITRQTKILIVNTPHNPTGKIYSRATLQALSNLLLNEYEKRQAVDGSNAQPIWIISDEAYNRIIFDHHEFISPAQVYPYTFICYTYAKTLLNPGTRLGYVALSDQLSLEYRLLFRKHFPLTQVANGFMLPDCVTQYMIQDIETLSISIDMQSMAKKLNRILDILSSIGYQIPLIPQGTFYILVVSPLKDDQEFCRRLSNYKVLCLPGSVCSMPGYFRLCLTATEEMIEKSRYGFEQAYQQTISSLNDCNNKK